MSTLSKRIREQEKNQPAPVAVMINPPDAAKPAPVVPYAPPKPEVMKGAEDQNPFAPVEPLPSTPVAAVKAPTPVATNLVIYVDARPDKAQGMNLTEEIERRTPAVIAAVRARDPSAVPLETVDVRQIKFGMGTTELLADFKRNPPTGVVLASAVGLSGQVVEVLTPIATDVIRSVR